MARTAILGWGSLIGDLRNLTEHVRGSWNLGGPKLFVEFSRISESRQGALTLVIDAENGDEVPTRFIESNRIDPNDVASDLRVREGTVIRHIGLIDSGFVRSKSQVVTDIIRAWAEQHNFDAVVWTDLPSNFAEERNMPFSVPNAINYLQQELSDVGLTEARQYINNAPAEVDTKLRQALIQNSWWQSLG